MPLFRRRTIWFPTLCGWLLLAGIFGGSLLLWILRGEAFLASTDRRPAEVLVVEGWIGDDGVRAAADEFKRGGYRYVVATGGATGHRWSLGHLTYTEIAEEDLLRAGIPRDQVIAAKPDDVARERTYESAVAVRSALAAKGLHPRAINDFTLGAHARRSRLVFAKVFHGESEVGVVSWRPAEYHDDAWWHSSERAQDFLKETVGYGFELFLNSGRW